jgi:ribosomal protein L11 methyltransferase
MSAPGRRWLELRARCPTAGEGAALIADALVALGGRAVEERDGWYVTHLQEPADPDAWVAAVREALVEATGLERVEVVTAWQAHEDWAESWKRGLAPRRIGSRVVVRPSWSDPLPLGPDDVEVVLDPGMAFGTAEHGTTRGCLRLLERALRPGDRVLDIGAGSGILAVAAALLGASEVIAVEGDTLACEALHENVAVNGCADRVRIDCAWADAERMKSYGRATGVIANLETGILLPLLDAFVAASDGWLIVSGILVDEWPAVERALSAARCAVVSIDADGEWCSALATIERG